MLDFIKQAINKANQPRFCINCRHCVVRQVKLAHWEGATDIEYCLASPTEPEYDYMTGERLNRTHERCYYINTDGKCKKYRLKDKDND
jgi:hypothetical protein